MVEVQFDLRSLRDLAPVRARRVGRLVSAGVSLLFALVVGYSVLEYLWKHRGFAGWSGQDSIVLAVPLMFVLAGVLFFAQAGPGDDFVTVDRRGITFLCSNNRRRAIGWPDARRSLTLELADGALRGDENARARFILRDRFPAVHFLTGEAFKGIIVGATAERLDVRKEASPYPGRSRVVVTRR